jgi:hypothetical protein
MSQVTREGYPEESGWAIGGVVFAAPLITSVVPPAAAATSSSTCGGPPPRPTVLCCPCTTGSGANKEECCQPPFTNKCVCVKAEGNSSKFCKPAANPAEGDALCGPSGADRPPCQQCCDNQHNADGTTGRASCGPLVRGPRSGTTNNCIDTGEFGGTTYPDLVGCSCCS